MYSGINPGAMNPIPYRNNLNSPFLIDGASDERLDRFGPRNVNPNFIFAQTKRIQSAREVFEGAPEGHRLKSKSLANLQGLEYLACPAGFEPTTPWFVGRILDS
jgi:hypothetical protein